MRYRRRRCTLIYLGSVGLGLVIVGAGLDIIEDVVLWQNAADPTIPREHLLTVGLTLPMRCLVAVGLAMVVGAGLWPGARWPSLATPAEDDSPGGTVICCSGGGIRAAAFALGGLQVLTERGIYAGAKQVVGVSGGGYVAAAHHVLRWSPDNHPDSTRQREWPDLGGTPAFALTSPELQWVRRHTRYVLDSIRAAAQAALSLLFGIMVNLLLITAILGAAAWTLAWLFLAAGRLHPSSRVGGQTIDEIAHTGVGGPLGEGWAFIG